MADNRISTTAGSWQTRVVVPPDPRFSLANERARHAVANAAPALTLGPGPARFRHRGDRPGLAHPPGACPAPVMSQPLEHPVKRSPDCHCESLLIGSRAVRTWSIEDTRSLLWL
jgi:hypothetical protein